MNAWILLQGILLLLLFSFRYIFCVRSILMMPISYFSCYRTRPLCIETQTTLYFYASDDN